MSTAAGVQVGQVWADADPRVYGRRVRVDEVDQRWAYVVPVQGGRRSRILLRFDRTGQASIRGYRLVEDAAR